MAAGPKPSRNQLKRAKKKADKQKVREHCLHIILHPNLSQTASEAPIPEPETDVTTDELTITDTSRDEVEPIVVDEMDFDNMSETDPLFDMYKGIIEKFQQADKEDPALKEVEKPEVYYDEDDDIPDEEAEDEAPKISKKKKKMMTQLSVAELKALVKKPELVEGPDVTAPDPRLLVHIKSYRNIVPVPNHWALKREYLSSKRGVEKASFSLPKFIQDTGIAEMRDAVLEKQETASLKQKQRERVAPKMGKLDIDYQKLYEAFFRFQTKPELTRYGEVYYEGKEYETNLKHLRPGELSDELKEALSIPPGAPPPWLINQQRFGPPPSYPALKVPGLNAPPPAGASWGFHPGGYGKPPVDEYNRPLYGGDVFGVLQTQQNQQLGEPVEKALWGELQAPEEESEEEEDDEEEEEEQEEANDQTAGGLETPSGMASAVPSEYGGVESMAGEFDLRKQRRGIDTEENTQPRAAYQVLPEQQIKSQGFFGGEKAYDLSAGQRNSSIPVLGQDDNGRKRKKPGDVDVAVDPDQLLAKDGMDKDDLKKLYDNQKQQEKGQWDYADLSDMIAEESRKRQKRDEDRKSRR